MKLAKDKALVLVEKRFGQQVAPVMEMIGQGNPLRTALLAALQDRLMIAEVALNRAGDQIHVAKGMPMLPEVWKAIRAQLFPGELVEWERLNKVVIDLVDRIENRSTEGHP